VRTPDEPGHEPVLDDLSERELAAEGATALPAREVMSTIRLGHGAMPINEALALNYESTDSVAFADAGQTVVMGPPDGQQAPNSIAGA